MPATTDATIELADVFRVAGPAYRADQAGHLSRDTLKVMAAIERCRTASLGGHVCQTASERDPGSASKRGSDSLSVQAG